MNRRSFIRQFSGAAVATATVPLALPGVFPMAFGAERKNAIQRENEKRGTTAWLLTQVEPAKGTSYDELCARRKSIEAFCSHPSIQAGETLRVFVSTDPESKYTAEIYRMGFYGGTGGRLVKSFRAKRGVMQPAPVEGPKHAIECHWKESFSFRIPRDWLSGVYLGKLTATASGNQAYFIFIVRDSRKSDFIFQCSDMTWQAYNRWPAWRSLYDFGDKKWHTAVGNEVGWDRPYSIYYNGLPARFNPLTNGSGEFLLWEHPLCFWMEKEGYDVTYISNLDTHHDGNGLLRAKGFLSVGHDEYWTQEIYDHVMAAREAGVNIAFLSGNSVSGRVYLKPSLNGTPNRIFGRWDQGKDAEDDGFPAERELMGSTTYGVGAADWFCEMPEHWLFEGTGMKKGDRIPQLVGWEYHGPPLRDDPQLQVLSRGKVRAGSRELDREYAATIYPGPKGNFVFNAATCWWSMLLARPPGAVNPPNTNFNTEGTQVQRITRNLLERMKSGPDRV